MKYNLSSFGSVRLSEEIKRRQISFQKVAEELTAMGSPTQRYSVWQWAHGIAHPNLRNAFTLETWSRGRIPADGWNVANEVELKKGRDERRSRRAR